MDNLVPKHPEDRDPALAGKSKEELLAELAECLRLTSSHMLRAAFIVRELEARGQNLSGLRPLLPWLRKIAAGQMEAQVLVRFGGSDRLLKTVSNLPIEDQKRLASGEPVELVVYNDDGQRAIRMADPLEMTKDQITQAFGAGHIREQSEQHLLLDDKQKEARKPKRKGENWNVDRERGGIVYARRHFIPKHELQAMLKALK